MPWKEILSRVPSTQPSTQDSPNGRSGNGPLDPNPLKDQSRIIVIPRPPSFPPPPTDKPAPHSVQAVASFDCRSTKYPNEKLICQSSELSDLDSKMSKLFDELLGLLNTADGQELKTSQRRWLRERLDCGMISFVPKQRTWSGLSVLARF
jgi:uncharacterized protein YecT (DUF1311 family)